MPEDPAPSPLSEQPTLDQAATSSPGSFPAAAFRDLVVVTAAVLMLLLPTTGAAQGTWTPTRTAGAPTAREAFTAVWTGAKLIIWGGWDGSGTNGGGIYDPVADAWTPTSTAGAPTARTSHTAVWTGSRMIVWGGFSYSAGGVYDPESDTWTATSVVGAPSARFGHTAVWTGSKMIVWGGTELATDVTNTGAIYDPATDTWTATSTVGAPSARDMHTAVWTGSKMIVWGGYALGGNDTGGVYDPATDTWAPTSKVGAPSGRVYHTAVWTGSRMIVWGGDNYPAYPTTGGIYDPATDTWGPTGMAGVSSGREGHTAIWTGSRMIVWGGEAGGAYLNTGAAYEPVAGTWSATATAGAPSGRAGHAAAWSGSGMVVWGGLVVVGGSTTRLDTGGVYSPPTYSADLAISMTDGQASVIPGRDVTYTIAVSNAGPAAASARVVDTFSPSLAGVSWTCVASGGSCAATGSGNIDQLVTLPSGSSVTFTATASLDPAAVGSLANTATVSVLADVVDPDPSNNSVTDTDTLTPTADLSITKTDGVAWAIPGHAVAYTITAANGGPSAAAGAQVSDAFATSLEDIAWTCVGSGGSCPASGSGNIHELVGLPPGTSVAFTVTATVARAASGFLSNTATVSAPVGVADPVPANNSATDTDGLTEGADLSITKTGPPFARRGTNLVYSIVVTNGGPDDATDVRVEDATPSGLTFVSNTGDCTTAFPCSLGTVPSGESRTVTATFAVPAGLDVSKPIANTAAVSSTKPDPDPTNDSDTATSLFGAFYTVRPCRLVDTRTSAQAPALQPGEERTYALAGTCGIPLGAAALSLNVTATGPTAPGNLRLYPGDMAAPLVSNLNYAAGQTRANNAVVAASADGSVAVTVKNSSVGTVHFILDVNGYFE